MRIIEFQFEISMMYTAMFSQQQHLNATIFTGQQYNYPSSGYSYSTSNVDDLQCTDKHSALTNRLTANTRIASHCEMLYSDFDKVS